MKQLAIIFCLLFFSPVASFAQERGQSEQKIKVKKEIPPFKKNIFALSVGFGKYSSYIFGLSYQESMLGLKTRSFKYTRRFRPQFGMTFYATRSKTTDFNYVSDVIKTRHAFLSFKFNSSAERPFQFFFSPGIGIGRYPLYSHPYVYGQNGIGYFDYAKVVREDFDNYYVDFGGEIGFEYHFGKRFIASISSQTLINADFQSQNSFMGGIGVKF